MLKFLVVLFLALVTDLTFAQTADSFQISGTAISANTNEPISEATIQFTKTKGVLTDSLGHFTIDGLRSGQYNLFFSALGYDSHDTTINVSNANISNLKWFITTDCPTFNIDKAFQDIKENKIKLFLHGSIAPISGIIDKDFTKEFGVAYYQPGDDETNFREECMKVYNRVIFKYLDKKFGGKWRKKVRQDVIGYE
jgi:hypothetical protein